MASRYLDTARILVVHPVPNAKRLCEYGKATAEQLALVLARAPRRAA